MDDDAGQYHSCVILGNGIIPLVNRRSRRCPNAVDRGCIVRHEIIVDPTDIE